MKISKKVAGVEYAIRDIVSAAREIELQGTTVDYLNIGDPVQSGFQPPQNVKQAMIDAINNGNNFYTRSEGLIELTDAIAKKENAKGLSISSENILFTNSNKRWNPVGNSTIEKSKISKLNKCLQRALIEFP